MDRYERLLKKAQEFGAKSAKIIDTSSIVIATWPTYKCKYGCPSYGSSPLCPPKSPKPDETKRLISEYKKAMLLSGEDAEKMCDIALLIEREAFLSGFYKAFAMYAGSERLFNPDYVKKLKEVPTKHRPIMDGAGIDIFETARVNGFDIEVLTKEGQVTNYFTMVLIE